MSRHSQEKGLLHYLKLSLSAVTLVVVLALAALIIVIPKLAGAVPMAVLTSSMEPRYPPGTLIVVQDIDTRDLRTGDVATYQIESGKPALITHRIIGINNGFDGSQSFVFKGDNNGVRDSKDIVSAQIVGKLWYSLPLFGYVSTWINGANRSLVIAIASIGLLGYSGFAILTGVLSTTRKRRAAAALGAPDSGDQGFRSSHEIGGAQLDVETAATPRNKNSVEEFDRLIQHRG